MRKEEARDRILAEAAAAEELHPVDADIIRDLEAEERNEHFEHLACLIWASAEGCIDYPHLDRLALPAPKPNYEGLLDADF